MLCAIWYHLYNLRNVENTMLLLKVSLPHGWFSRFLNCTRITISCKASQMYNWLSIQNSESRYITTFSLRFLWLWNWWNIPPSRQLFPVHHMLPNDNIRNGLPKSFIFWWGRKDMQLAGIFQVLRWKNEIIFASTYLPFFCKIFHMTCHFSSGSSL